MNGELTTIAIILGNHSPGHSISNTLPFAALGARHSRSVQAYSISASKVSCSWARFQLLCRLETGNLWLALLAAIIIGVLMGLFMAVVSITFQAEQGISGIGLYLFGLGMSSLLFKTMIGSVRYYRFLWNCNSV